MPLFTFSRELGIDLGTMNTVIAEGNQILLQEPTVVAVVVSENLLQRPIKHVSGPMQIFKPKIMITVPYGVTSVESRAVHEAGLGASNQVYMISQPLAAALGIDLPINTP